MTTLKYIQSLILIYVFVLAPTVRAQGEMITPARLNLMPVPASVQIQTGRLPITSSFSVAVKNYTDDRLRAGIARMLRRLGGRTVLTVQADLATDESAAALVVQCERAGEII